MRKKIYALLVGINEYADALIPADTPHKLKGCLNDIRVFKEYLENKSSQEGIELKVEELKDQSATRDAVIKGFREHLCQASKNDIVLFYYSGHGSREKITPELKDFLKLEIDFIETLVCWDSRTANGNDLADKEIAVLIGEIARNQPQIVIILDCCHSGGLVRNSLVERSIPSKMIARPSSGFIFSFDQIKDLFLSGSLDREEANWLTGLQSDYILLAACRSDESAREDRNKNRGVFSSFLTDILNEQSNRISYRDIFNRTNILVKSFCSNQSPQIITTNSDYLNRQFLGETLNQSHYFTVSCHANFGWVIDGGLLHGIKSNSQTEKIRLAVFPLEVDDIRQLRLAIATAEILEVLPQLSKLNIIVDKNILNRELIYKAVVTSIPLSPLGIYLEGDESEINLVRQAISTASFGEQPSLSVCEVTEPEAEFYLLIRDSQCIIHRSNKEGSEIATDSPAAAVQSLEHIARWKNIATLVSPPNSRISSNSVRLKIYQEDGLEIKESQIRLAYKYINDEWQPPAFRIQLINNSSEKLYCTLLNLTELYAIKTIPLDGNLVCYLEPGQSIWALDKNIIQSYIPDNILQNGDAEYVDILKLICNTSDFDASLLEQNSIFNSVNLSRQGYSHGQARYHQSTLNQLMKKVNRDIKASLETAPICDDWVTSELLITTVRAFDIKSS